MNTQSKYNSTDSRNFQLYAGIYAGDYARDFFAYTSRLYAPENSLNFRRHRSRRRAPASACEDPSHRAYLSLVVAHHTRRTH